MSVVGKGRVTSSPSGINCPGACWSRYPTDARVRLVAHPARGWKLKSWAVACQGSRQCVTKLVGPTKVKATFGRIPPKAVPANLVLRKSGFSQSIDTAGIDDVSFGMVIRNTSPDEDALHVSATVNLLAGNGSIIQTYPGGIFAIPAATAYYYGHDSVLDGDQRVAKLEVVLHIGDSAKKSLTLPPAADVHLSQDDSGGMSVEGELSNPFTKTLASSAGITGVVFDSAGNVLGGGSTFPLNDVPPGTRIGFAMDVSGIRTSQAPASAQVSAEPEFTD